MKRKIASVVAMSLLGLQALTGVASAARTDACVYSSGILQAVGDDGSGNGNDGDVNLWVVGGLIDCEADGSSFTPVSLASVKEIEVSADGTVTFYLLNDAATDAPFSLSGKSLSISAGESLVLDVDTYGAGGATTDKGVSVSVSDTAFSLQGSTGEAVAAAITFTGNGGADSFDASKLTGIGITADGAGGADTLKGGDDIDVLTGGSADSKVDTLVGGEGDDTLVSENFTTASGTFGDLVFPGDGSNDIQGGAGLVSYLGAQSGVEIDLATAATPAVTHDDGEEDTFDAPSGIQKIRSWGGSDKADKFIGSTGDDRFSGNGGADVATGGKGSDTLSGGDGADRLRGAYGNDDLSGGAGNDTLSGGAGDDLLRGFGGDDVLYGRGGADTLRGDAGADEAWGGTGGDVCGAEVTDHCEFIK